MFSRSLARTGKTAVAKLNNQTPVRTFRASAQRLGGDGDEHHDHAMFEDLPFNKSSMAIMVGGALVAGVGAVWGSCVHQNKKHGFSGVSAN